MINHVKGTFVAPEFFNHLGIAEIADREPHPRRNAATKPARKIIHAHDVAPGAETVLRDMRPNESRYTGDEDFRARHGGTFKIRVSLVEAV